MIQPKFLKRFKAKNRDKYEEIIKILSNSKEASKLYFDHIDKSIQGILNQTSILERQIIVKSILNELNPDLSNNFEIFSIEKFYDGLNSKEKDVNDINSNEWLNILFNSDQSNKNFKIYDPS